MNTLNRDTTKLEKVKRPFPRISYDEASDILKKSNEELEFQYGDDFGGTDETIISDAFDRPVMVHRYPAAVKAFYMKNDPADTSKALCVDMLAPEGGFMFNGGVKSTNYNDPDVQRINTVIIDEAEKLSSQYYN